MKYAYYPGCSLQHSAASYDKSTRDIAAKLGLELEEIPDWNCCGATEYFSVNSLPAYSLVARNLALVEGKYDQVIAPCSACYLNLRKTNDYVAKYPDLGAKVNEALAAGGLSLKGGKMQVRHLLDVIVTDVGFKAIEEKVEKPLTGLRVAPYYGCLIVRPFTGFHNPEYPTSMDRLMSVLGAEVVDFPLKAHCCGGHMTQITAPVAYEMIRRILQNASEYEADAIVTICPMCHLNLDAYQSNVNRHFGTNYNIPTLYFTQVMGLAMGMTAKDMGIGSEIVSAANALAKIGVEPPPPPKKPRPSKDALPMPKLPEEREEGLEGKK